MTKLSPDGTALVYSTYLGGNNADSGTGIAVDSSGSAYVTGSTGSTDFPTTTNAFQRKNAGEFDAFVTKLSPDGTALVYSTYLGGGTDANGRTPSDHPREAIPRDGGEAIAVDSKGSAYVTGVTGSIDFPTTKNAVQGKFGGGSGVFARDAFVTKLSADGGTLVYSTYLGGSGNENGFGIAVDSSGSAYVTGSTSSTDFPTKSPEQPANAGGSLDAFVTKLGPDGTTLVYSTYLGGSGTDGGRGIAVDSSGSAYVTGSTSSTDFPTKNPEQGKNAGDFDAFATKLSADGKTRVYSTYLGGGAADFGRGIALDSSGSAYVTGSTSSTDFPTQNPEQSKSAGDFDAFVTKLSPDGTALAYSTYLGGSGTDGGNGIAVDSSGSAYVTGQTNSTDFPTENPEQGKNAGGQNQGFDAFVTKLSEVPVVATGAASSVSTGSATLNGTVNPSGKAASYHFEYGTSTSYGQSTPTQSAGADSQTHPESAAVAGLAPGTTYHFRIVATNSAGTSLGADQVFTTQASPAAPRAPQASTGPAESVSASAAKLTGTVNPNAQATSYRFDYGTSTSYGASTSSQSAGAGSSNRSVAATLHALKPGRTYHYRLLATSPAGTSSGGDRTFKTQAVKTRATCVVPNLHHNTLAQAKKLLASHHCALGRVTRPRQNHSGRLVVVKQSPRSGSHRPGGTPVALTLAHLTRRVPVVPRFTG